MTKHNLRYPLYATTPCRATPDRRSEDEHAVAHQPDRRNNSPTIRTVVKLAGVLKVAPSKIVVRMEQLLAGAEE